MRHLHLLVVMVAAAASSTLATAAVTLADVKPHIDRGDYTAALAVLSTVMDKPAYAKHAQYNKYYGQCLCLTGRYAESVPYLEYGMKHGQSGSMYYLGIARQHLYDFDGAIEVLEGYKKKLKLPPLWTARVDSIVAECQIGQRAVHHVEDIVIVDSLTLPLGEFWQSYRMGAESGRYTALGASGGVAFENAPADYRILTTADGQLADAHALAEGGWEAAQPIAALTEWQGVEWPWLRTGGEELYFASAATPGMGGLDIYRTTYNPETETWYTPVRLGMPYNSPYNDYALAIDETHGVGWWATDRSAPADSVTVYLFIVPDAPTYLDEAAVRRGRIDRIADTWRDPMGYADLVAQVLAAPQEAVPGDAAAQGRVDIPIDDRTVYHSPDEFRSSTARQAYDEAQRVAAALADAQSQLDTLRQAYHDVRPAADQAIRHDILTLEQRVATLRTRLAALRKEYRSLEASLGRE